MKFQSLYTNTSSPKAIAGLLLITLATAYVKENATEIVDGTIAKTKDARRSVESKLRGDKQRYSVLRQDSDGKLYDTGKKVWK